MPKLRNGSIGDSNPVSRLRVRHSTTELPRSTMSNVNGRNGGIKDKHYGTMVKQHDVIYDQLILYCNL